MRKRHSSDEARQIHETRWTMRSYEECRWSPTYDRMDIFDLRFLFDEEEIQETKILYERAFDLHGFVLFDGMDYGELSFDEDGNIMHPYGKPPPPPPAKVLTKKQRRQKLSSEEAAEINDARWAKREYEEGRWSPTIDRMDIFDLRFLYDEEEIQPKKLQYELALYMYGFLEFDGIDYVEIGGPLTEEEKLRVEVFPEPYGEEVWDDEPWPYHFNVRQGFFLPAYENYDSGLDDPDVEECPSSDDDEMTDEDRRDLRLAEYMQRQQLGDLSRFEVV